MLAYVALAYERTLYHGVSQANHTANTGAAAGAAGAAGAADVVASAAGSVSAAGEWSSLSARPASSIDAWLFR